MARAAVLRCEGKPDELILIELQSTVQMEDGSKVAGQDLGILDIKDGDVTLTNGPRCLHGKMQELKSPLVLMEKTGQEDAGDAILTTRGVVNRKAVFSQRPQLSV
ncbi:unnamed protein product [Durusdinium trenchii]|uniref:Uncharacterized protein n=1 Tax=Durusdinium trenchii TaxID=1381693 RepID=A0ABP0MD81_9DINO